MHAENTIERRRHDRFALPHQYTSVTVQRAESMVIAELHGHAYDISETGVRVELDEPLDVATAVSVQVILPLGGGAVTATAEVVWVNPADDDPGPRRMALRFKEYLTPADHARLVRFLGEMQPSRAA